MGRYLVTGGAGYIGSHVALALLDAGHDVVILDDLSTGHRNCIPSGCKMVLGRISDTGVLDTTFSTWKIDGIMHMASLSLVGESIKQPTRYFRENMLNAICLIEKAVQHGIKKIVFSSTAAVYGDRNINPIDEKIATLAPVNPYGESKLMVERTLRWAKMSHGINYVSLRYFNAAGADPILRSGELHEPETHLIPLAIMSALGLKKELTIFGNDYDTLDGTAIRDYIHVSDIASAHLLAMSAMDEIGGIEANIGTGQGYSVMDVINAVERYSGKLVPYSINPRRSGDPAVLVANPAKFKAATGWEPALSTLDQMVETATRWIAKNNQL